MSKNEKSWFDRLTEDITDSYFEARNSEYTTPRAVLGIVHFDDGSFLEVELDKDNGVTVMPYHADEKCDRVLPNITKYIEDNLVSWEELGEQWEDALPDYKKLELPVKPNFKVGDWIVQNDNGTVSQITKVINAIDEDGEYRAYEHTNGYFAACFENEYHLWTIADAKDGDILSAKIDGDDYILIFKQIKDGWIETYGHYYITIDKFCAPTQMFYRNYQGRLYPATQEQYRTLFKKMHDDGYEWDFDKNELKKIPVKPKFKVGDSLQSGSYFTKILSINLEEGRYYCDNRIISFENQDLWHLVPKPHYNIANFHAGMPVLVRVDESDDWRYVQFSHTRTMPSYRFVAGAGMWNQCIPFEGNEHLLGTTDMPSEEFINW